MKSSGLFYAPLIIVVILFAGCSGDRSVLELETPHIYVHTRYSAKELMSLVRVEDCTVKPYPDGEISDTCVTIVVEGTGNIDWESVSLRIREKSVVINGTLIESDPEYSRNVVVEKNGRVAVDRFISWER